MKQHLGTYSSSILIWCFSAVVAHADYSALAGTARHPVCGIETWTGPTVADYVEHKQILCPLNFPPEMCEAIMLDLAGNDLEIGPSPVFRECQHIMIPPSWARPGGKQPVLADSSKLVIGVMRTFQLLGLAVPNIEFHPVGAFVTPECKTEAELVFRTQVQSQTTQTDGNFFEILSKPEVRECRRKYFLRLENELFENPYVSGVNSFDEILKSIDYNNESSLAGLRVYIDYMSTLSEVTTVENALVKIRGSIDQQ